MYGRNESSTQSSESNMNSNMIQILKSSCKMMNAAGYPLFRIVEEIACTYTMLGGAEMGLVLLEKCCVAWIVEPGQPELAQGVSGFCTMAP